MRALLVLLALVVLVAAGGLYLGFFSFEQTRAGSVAVQTPKFNADVGHVSVGTRTETVTVPTVNVERAADAPANAQ